MSGPIPLAARVTWGSSRGAMNLGSRAASDPCLDYRVALRQYSSGPIWQFPYAKQVKIKGFRVPILYQFPLRDGQRRGSQLREGSIEAGRPADVLDVVRSLNWDVT